MEQSDQIEQYLQRVLEFKSQRDLHDNFLNEKERNQLLKDLTIELGFDEHLWKVRGDEAALHFIIQDQLRDNNKLNNLHFALYEKMILQHLLKSVHLDPFNEEYLQAYLFQHYQKWKPEKRYSIQYMQLIKPNSTEATSLQVQLGVSPYELNYDYLSTEVISSYVNELVFLQERNAPIIEVVTKQKLTSLAKEAGIDANTLKEIDDEVAEMLKLVKNANHSHFTGWKDLHIAYLTVDKMVDLAPYNPRVLEEAIHFYCSTLVSVLLDAGKISYSKNEKVAFFQAVLESKKPKPVERIKKAEESLETGRQLLNRYCSLPAAVFEKKDDWSMLELRELDLSLRGFRSEFLTPLQITGIFKSYEIAFAIYTQQLNFKQKNGRFGLLFGAFIYLLSSAFCVFVLGSIHFLWTFVIVPALVAFGVASLHEKWWRKYGMQVPEA